MNIDQSKGLEPTINRSKYYGVFFILAILIIQYFIFPFDVYEGTRYFSHSSGSADFTLSDAGQLRNKAMVPWLTLSPWILYARTLVDTGDFGPIGPFIISIIGSIVFLFIGLNIYTFWLKQSKNYRLIVTLGLFFTIIISYAYGKNFYDINYYKRDIVYAETLQKLKTISGKEKPFPNKTKMYLIRGSALTEDILDKQKEPVEMVLEYGGNGDPLDDIRLRLDFLAKPELPLSEQLCKSIYNPEVQSKVNIVEAKLLKQTVYYCKTDQGVFHYIGFLDSERTVSFFYSIPGGQLDREMAINQMVMDFLNYYIPN